MSDEPRDVNERVVGEWVAESSPGERVRSVLKRSYEFQSVGELAERACVSVDEAGEVLVILEEGGFVESRIEDGEELFRRSPSSRRLEKYMRDLGYVRGEDYQS